MGQPGDGPLPYLFRLRAEPTGRPAIDNGIVVVGFATGVAAMVTPIWWALPASAGLLFVSVAATFWRRLRSLG